MAFSRKTSKALKRVHQFFLNPTSYGQPCFSEQITPNLPEIVFSFRIVRLGYGQPEFYISRITGIISGRFCVCLEIYRFKSARIFSLITP